jgi:hypothetical protein
MITPKELQKLNDGDTKQADDLEGEIDHLLKNSPYFGVELQYGNPDNKVFSVPARVWRHVLEKYIAAGYGVEPPPDRGLFDRPYFRKDAMAWPTIRITAQTK